MNSRRPLRKGRAPGLVFLICQHAPRVTLRRELNSSKTWCLARLPQAHLQARAWPLLGRCAYCTAPTFVGLFYY